MATKAKGKPAMSNGAAAVKALGDAVTGGNGTVEVAHALTFQRDVEVHLSVEEVVAYLTAKGWKEQPKNTAHGGTVRLFVLRDATGSGWSGAIWVPWETGALQKRALRELHGAILAIAQGEGRHPLDVVADIHAARGGTKGHSMSDAPCSACGDLDGCHKP